MGLGWCGVSHNMTMTETFARELADALYGANTEGPDPTFLRVCESYDIHLTDPCGYCHGDDGAHETWCQEGFCACGNPPANCTCDALADARAEAWFETHASELIDGEDA